MRLLSASFFKFTVLISLSVSGDCRNESETTGFLYFLAEATRNFTGWVRKNNLDPSHINPTEYELDINSFPHRLNLTLKLRHEQLMGYGFSRIRSLGAGLSNGGGTMKMNRQFYGPIVLQGYYSVNGTEDNGRPITQEGRWIWELGVEPNQIEERVQYTFTISPDGYVVISNPPKFYSLDTMLQNTDLRLKDFYDWYQFSPIVHNAIQIAIYNKYISWYHEHPTGSLMHRYFTELFKKTPYDEIIEYPGPHRTGTTGKVRRTNNSIYVSYADTSGLQRVNSNNIYVFSYICQGYAKV